MPVSDDSCFLRRFSAAASGTLYTESDVTQGGNWLHRQIRLAKEETATWPEWKRRAYRQALDADNAGE